MPTSLNGAYLADQRFGSKLWLLYFLFLDPVSTGREKLSSLTGKSVIDHPDSRSRFVEYLICIHFFAECAFLGHTLVGIELA